MAKRKALNHCYSFNLSRPNGSTRKKKKGGKLFKKKRGRKKSLLKALF